MQTIVEDTKSQIANEKYTFIARTLFAVAAAFIGLLNFVFYFQVLLLFRFSHLDKLLNQTILYNSNYMHYQVILNSLNMKVSLLESFLQFPTSQVSFHQLLEQYSSLATHFYSFHIFG
jgi:hypothetical protein